MKTITKSFNALIFLVIFLASKQSVSQTCTANYNFTYGANGLVTFTSTSVGTNSLTNYWWTFGNGGTFNAAGAAGINTSQTYTTNGTYTVSLSLAGPSCTSSISQTIQITNSNPCPLVANFSYSNGIGGLVTFFNNSGGTNSLTTSYLWNYGDGTSSTLTAAPHTYTNTGVYTVTLTASNSATCTSTYTANVFVNCIISSSFTSAAGANGQVNFTSTSIGTSASSSYTWNYGNGNTSSGVNIPTITTTYTANGIYTVSLQVYDPVSNCSSSSFQFVSVSTVTAPCNLAANFTYSLGTNGLVFFYSSSTGTNPGTSYAWNFGNNTNGTAVSAAAIYTANGVYTVTLNTNNGTIPLCVSTATQLVTINTVTSPCLVNAGFNYTVGANGQVNFSSTSTGTQSGSTYLWSYSNGTNTPAGSGANSTYTYAANGIYVVTLFVNNNAVPTCTSSVTQTINVTTANGPCNLNAAFTYSVGANGLVNFYNTSTGTNSLCTYYWYSWPNYQTSIAANPTFSYTSNGTYTVRLLVTNPTMTFTCQDSIVQYIPVNTVTGPCSLTASFAHTVGANGLVNFSSTSLGTNSITTYMWNYGDGTFGTGVNSSHTYGTSGAHTVVLTAMNGNTLCVNSATQTINITGIPCVANANFTLSPTNIPQFWTATPAYPWNVTAATWNWGDGSSSNLLYTSHSYSAAGLYGICLSVTVSCGSNAIACSTYSVYRTTSTANIININVEPPALVPVGLEDLNQDVLSFSLYPNPNQGLVNLELNAINKTTIDVFVYDLSGRKVYQEIDLKLVEENHKQIDLSVLPNGIYLIQVEQGGQKMNKKLIISKD